MNTIKVRCQCNEESLGDKATKYILIVIGAYFGIHIAVAIIRALTN